jgi:putative transcriptional regulator
MISFQPLMITLVVTGISKTELRIRAKFSMPTLAKISKNEHVSLDVIDRICSALNCNIEDVIKYVPDKEETKN